MAFEAPIPQNEEADAHLKRVLDEHEVQRAKRACGEGEAARAVAVARNAAEGAQAVAQGS